MPAAKVLSRLPPKGPNPMSRQGQRLDREADRLPRPMRDVLTKSERLALEAEEKAGDARGRDDVRLHDGGDRDVLQDRDRAGGELGLQGCRVTGQVRT